MQHTRAFQVSPSLVRTGAATSLSASARASAKPGSGHSLPARSIKRRHTGLAPNTRGFKVCVQFPCRRMPFNSNSIALPFTLKVMRLCFQALPLRPLPLLWGCVSRGPAYLSLYIVIFVCVFTSMVQFLKWLQSPHPLLKRVLG